MFQNIITFIQGVGFPCFVAVWLLVRTDKLLRELKDAIALLRDSIILSTPTKSNL